MPGEGNDGIKITPALPYVLKLSTDAPKGLERSRDDESVRVLQRIDQPGSGHAPDLHQRIDDLAPIVLPGIDQRCNQPLDSLLAREIGQPSGYHGTGRAIIKSLEQNIHCLVAAQPSECLSSAPAHMWAAITL